MSAAIQALVAAVMDLRPGYRGPDLFAVRQAIAARRHGERGAPTRIPRWHDEVEYLFCSLRQFGGSLHDVAAEVRYIGDLEPSLARRLTVLDVSLMPVTIVDPRNPHANKLRMLETMTPYDVLVMLDLDTIVVGDFSPYLRTDMVQAMPTEQNWITVDQWRLLYDFLGLPLPDDRIPSPATGEEIVPYFNTGVILAPRQHAAWLHESWLGLIRLLLDRWREAPAEIQRFSYYIDEIAFALAVNTAGLPFRPLPLEMNLPTHIPISDEFAAPAAHARIAHHYHRLTSQGLMDVPYPRLAEMITILNALVRKEGMAESSVRVPETATVSGRSV